MKPLFFHHKFTNGIEVKMTVARDSEGHLLMLPSKTKFHEGVEDEYELWCRRISEAIWDASNDEERALDFISGLNRVNGN